MSKELKDIVLFAIKRIAPNREDLLRDVEELNAPAMTVKTSFSSSISRAENLAALYYEVMNRQGNARVEGEKELRSLILGRTLPLVFPDCIPLTRLVELYDEIEGISLRYVNGEITEEQYKKLLARE